MTTEGSFPDVIASRAQAEMRALVANDADEAHTTAALDELVQRSVLLAFGCTCPSPQATVRTCPLHGAMRRARDDDYVEPVMPSRADSWEEDPYDGYTSAERREGVQETLRTATEFLRAFRSELAATIRRGRAAQEQLDRAIEHATLSGGLTYDEMKSAETALSAVQYALRQLYVAGNHVGDGPGSARYEE